jgi:hypothetical protein
MSDSPVSNGPPEVGPTVTALESDPRWRSAEQIASSSTFRRSPRLRELWLYIAKNSLAGRDDQLTESEIARQVFGRGLDYVATDDSIVRSSARQLRWKLKEAVEKHDTPWSIEIPKGRYVARFQLRTTVIAANASTGLPEPQTRKPLPPASRRGSLIFILAAAFTVSLAANVWFGVRTGRSGSAPKLGLMANLVMAHSGETNVVLDDYAYVLMAPRPLLPNDELLNNYANREYVPSSAAPSQDPALLRFWHLLGTRYIVSLGAAVTEDRIVRSVPQQNKVVLRHARNVVARDFQRGNYILFGSTPNNPWTALFEDQLNFRFARDKDAAMFVNTMPGKGEAVKYDTSQVASLNSGPGYARIVYLPNLTHTGFVVLITGLNMVTAEAAGEFATNAAEVPLILSLFGAKRMEDLPYFEVLLRTSAVDNMPKAVSVVAYRRLGKP